MDSHGNACSCLSCTVTANVNKSATQAKKIVCTPKGPGNVGTGGGVV